MIVICDRHMMVFFRWLRWFVFEKIQHVMRVNIIMIGIKIGTLYIEIYGALEYEASTLIRR